MSYTYMPIYFCMFFVFALFSFITDHFSSPNAIDNAGHKRPVMLTTKASKCLTHDSITSNKPCSKMKSIPPIFVTYSQISTMQNKLTYNIDAVFCTS